MQTKLKTLKLPLLLWVVLSLTSCKASEEEVEAKPNIIIIFTDDQGYADLGCYGAEGFETPEIDKLAQHGVRFTNFYVPAAVCTPSRAGLLTGRYPKRSNLHQSVLFPFSEGGLSQEEYTMAEMLKGAGYQTSCIGKWHLGHKPEFMPNQHGFDEFYGVPYSNDMDRYHYKSINFKSPPLPLYRNEKLIESGPDQAYLTKRYTEEAVKQIKNRGEKPFFMYLAHNMPHVPLHASPAFKGKSKIGLYGDVIMELDWGVGEIVKTLKEENIFENTIIIFTSDNGPELGSAKPLRGKKTHTWDGGQRVPGIISWPNKIRHGRVIDETVNTMDLFPTLAKISNAKLPDSLNFDGIDISHLLLTDQAVQLRERPFYFYATNGKIEGIRMGKWKLHIAKSRGWDSKQNGAFTTALYNLEQDIAEQHNLANKFPKVVESLSKMIDDFNSEL